MCVCVCVCDLSLCSDAGLGQSQPQARVRVVDLHDLQQGVKRSGGVTGVQLLESEVVENDVATVDSQDPQRPP